MMTRNDAIVTVEYYPKSRAWPNPKTGKTQYFTSLSVDSVSLAAAHQPAAAPTAYQQSMPTPSHWQQQPAATQYAAPQPLSPQPPSVAASAAPVGADDLPF